MGGKTLKYNGDCGNRIKGLDKVLLKLKMESKDGKEN